MFAALAVAITGVASATEVYTYKATVKHTYLKIKRFTRVLNVPIAGGLDLYVRYNKTSTLEGFLIQDDTQALSAVNGGAGTISSVDPQPGNRCFLVAKNKSPEKNYKFAAIIPGIIDVKWYDDKLSAPGTSPAQGYLYLGGEPVVAYVGTTFLAADANLTAYAPRVFATHWRRMLPAATPVPTYGIDDYWFTSAYLFGQYNQPAWAGSGLVQEFADTWMNHAGFGKVKYSAELCCGDGSAGVTLDNLSGNVKVGIWLCTETGDDNGHTDPLGVVRRGLLEDQLWMGVALNDPLDPGFTTYNIGVVPSARRVMDMWGDGNLSLGTTDVGTGTFSIKRTTKKPFDATNMVAVSADELNTITVTWGLAAGLGGRRTLLSAIKTALIELKTDTTFLGNPVGKGATHPSGVNGLINASFYSAYLQ